MSTAMYPTGEANLAYLHNLKTRALAAYFRSGGGDQPASGMTGIYMAPYEVKNRLNEHGEQFQHTYIRLANVNGTLAIYRELNSGTLKRLKRWPASVESGTAESLPEFLALLEQHHPEIGSVAMCPDLSAVAELDGMPA